MNWRACGWSTARSSCAPAACAPTPKTRPRKWRGWTRICGVWRWRTEGDTTAINAQRARLAELGEREAALLTRLSGERARQGRLLSSLQMMSREPPPPLLIPADRAVDTVRAAILMQAMAPALRDRADALLEQQVDIQNTRRRAALASEALFTVESAQMNRRAEIETLRGRRRELAVILRADADRAERAARALEARIETLGGASAPLEPGAARSATAAAPGGRDQSDRPGGRVAERPIQSRREGMDLARRRRGGGPGAHERRGRARRPPGRLGRGGDP